jgi:predicted nucleotidyltransferase
MASLINILAALAQGFLGSAEERRPASVDRTPDYILRLNAARDAAERLPSHVDPGITEKLYALHEEAATLAGLDIAACMMIANEMEDLLDRAHAGEFDRAA